MSSKLVETVIKDITADVSLSLMSLVNVILMPKFLYKSSDDGDDHDDDSADALTG